MSRQLPQPPKKRGETKDPLEQERWYEHIYRMLKKNWLNDASELVYHNNANLVGAHLDSAEIGDIAGGNYVQIGTSGETKFVGTAHIPYGSMYEEDGVTTVTLTTVATYYPITSAQHDGGSNQFTFQNNSELKCLVAGKYVASWSMALSLDTSDTTVAGIVLIGTTAQQNTENAARMKENGVVYSVGGTGVISLAVNDVVRLGIERETGIAAVVATVQHANLTLFQVGG
jgi:hypothetical protein